MTPQQSNFSNTLRALVIYLDDLPIKNPITCTFPIQYLASIIYHIDLLHKGHVISLLLDVTTLTIIMSYLLVMFPLESSNSNLADNLECIAINKEYDINNDGSIELNVHIDEHHDERWVKWSETNGPTYHACNKNLPVENPESITLCKIICDEIVDVSPEWDKGWQNYYRSYVYPDEMYDNQLVGGKIPLPMCP